MSQQERKRGGCLTAFLIMTLIMVPLAGLYYLLEAFGVRLATFGVRQAIPSMPGWSIPVLGLLSIPIFLFSLAIWKWKKWGIYGFCASASLAFVINLSIGVPIAGALLGLVSIVILVLLVSRVWSYMENAIPDEQPQQILKYSGLGIASFIISLVVSGYFIVVNVLAYGVAVTTPEPIVLGSLYFFGAVACLSGIGVGIAGVLQKNRRRVFSILGLVLNGTIFLGVTVSMITTIIRQ